MTDDDRCRTADDRSQLLRAMVAPIMTFVCAAGMIGAAVLGHWLTLAIFAVVAIIFGSLSAGVETIDVNIRRDGVRYRAQTKEPVCAKTDYEIKEPASPPPSRGQDAA